MTAATFPSTGIPLCDATASASFACAPRWSLYESRIPSRVAPASVEVQDDGLAPFPDGARGRIIAGLTGGGDRRVPGLGRIRARTIAREILAGGRGEEAAA